MVCIAKDACGYLADIILEYIIEGDLRNVIHVNTHLIKADSPEKAYKKAIMLGRSCAFKYKNTEGKKVVVAFCGLRELKVIHESLDDGAEVTFEEWIGVSKKRLRRWLRAKASLAVFTKLPSKSRKPNYMPESVMKQLEQAGFQRTQLGLCSNNASTRPKSARPKRKKSHS